MAYHPAIGDIRTQLPRVGLVAAMLAAAGAMLALGTERPDIPSERWYRLAGQEVMQADVAFRFGMWLEQLSPRLPWSVQRQAHFITERAVAAYERHALVGEPNPGAVYRLGIIYGHRGYHKQAEEFFAWAGLEKQNSNLYYALSQVYADDPGGPADDLKAQTAILADQAGWLADISLQDCYRRLGDDEKVKEVAMRGALRARRFGIAIALLGSLMVGLVILGVVLLAIFAFRRGLTPLRRRAQLPFLVPWTFIDVAEIIALVPFAMVIAGIAGGLLWHTPSDAAAWPLARPLLLTAQYSFAALVCLTVIFKRVRARSSWPSRSLGLRAPQPLRLIALGVATYGVFMALIFLAAVALRGLLGETIPLAATTEDLISRTRSIGEIITYFVLVCIIAPIVEEIIFRGYVYAGIRRLVGAPQAMLLGGLLFWAVHLNPDALLLITLIGITLSYVYERTRSLLPGMVAHGLHNAVVLAALVVHSI